MIDDTIAISSSENTVSIASGVKPPVVLTAHINPAMSTNNSKPTNVNATIGLTDAFNVLTHGADSDTSLASCWYNASRSCAYV